MEHHGITWSPLLIVSVLYSTVNTHERTVTISVKRGALYIKTQFIMTKQQVCRQQINNSLIVCFNTFGGVMFM